MAGPAAPSDHGQSGRTATNPGTAGPGEDQCWQHRDEGARRRGRSAERGVEAPGGRVGGSLSALRRAGRSRPTARRRTDPHRVSIWVESRIGLVLEVVRAPRSAAIALYERLGCLLVGQPPRRMDDTVRRPTAALPVSAGYNLALCLTVLNGLTGSRSASDTASSWPLTGTAQGRTGRNNGRLVTRWSARSEPQVLSAGTVDCRLEHECQNPDSSALLGTHTEGWSPSRNLTSTRSCHPDRRRHQKPKQA